MSVTPVQIKRIAAIWVGVFSMANGAFYKLSAGYFDSSHELVGGVSVSSYSPDQMMDIRLMFGVFALAVVGCSLLGGIWPRLVGHLLPALFSACYLGAAIIAFRHDSPSVLWVTLFVLGILKPVLAWRSYHHRARSAWAFLVAICGVLAVASLFGAPQIARGLGISVWVAMMLPGLEAVATVTLISLRDEYIERESVTA